MVENRGRDLALMGILKGSPKIMEGLLLSKHQTLCASTIIPQIQTEYSNVFLEKKQVQRTDSLNNPKGRGGG